MIRSEIDVTANREPFSMTSFQSTRSAATSATRGRTTTARIVKHCQTQLSMISSTHVQRTPTTHNAERQYRQVHFSLIND